MTDTPTRTRTEIAWWRASFSVNLSSAEIKATDDYTFRRRSVPEVIVYYDAFPVLRATKKGVWLGSTYTATGEGRKQRFVLREARKRWACPTQEEALESLLARTRRRLTLLSAQVGMCKAGIDAVGGSIPYQTYTRLWRIAEVPDKDFLEYP